ncbi:hypothetical protein ABL78_1102 [Leptomonas seymouri]|uniref:Uncharacterized protein n=1 Tax=Leptomonas seymouri TaxID=5684 RepID=A0A0N1PDG7_LEPSE|nr:hypothetical protein ABL78_1102 [Leptomonas seymouri]|eukprot:KPI89722.1 hypothetical protein ABL78_1102 [Leptomonas seymouri]
MCCRHSSWPTRLARDTTPGGKGSCANALTSATLTPSASTGAEVLPDSFKVAESSRRAPTVTAHGLSNIPSCEVVCMQVARSRVLKNETAYRLHHWEG